MIQFQAKYLPALMAFKAKQDIRYYLEGIHICPHADGGAVLVATNGHILMAIRDSGAICSEPTTIRINDAVKRLKTADIVSVNEVTQRLIVYKDHEEVFVQPGKCIIEYKYPDWQKVMPDFKNLSRAVADHVKADYLSIACLAHPDRSLYRTRTYQAAGVRFWQEGPTKCIAVEYEGHPEYCAILMPIRENVCSSKHLPDWVRNFANRP